MLTVACVYKYGKDFDFDYVMRLEAGVKKHLSLPYRFLCLSDMMPPCNWLRLEHNWPGWWSKMELYRLEPPVLYFDLDTIITGDLSEIATNAAQHPFIALRDFYREKGLGSGMMAWAEDHRWLYQRFAMRSTHFMEKYGKRGDQAYLEEHLKPAPAKWQDLTPGQVCSYKVHVQQNCAIPQDCRVVCFHGRPRPRDIEWDLSLKAPNAA